MIIPFEIADRHIALGTRNDACGCPAALALAECVGPGATVLVFAHRLEIGGKPCVIPAPLSAWVRAYDRGEPVEARGFVVDTDVLPWRGL